MKELQNAADKLEKTMAGIGKTTQGPLDDAARKYKQASDSATAYERALQRLGNSMGTVNKSQASSLSGMTNFVRTQEGLNNAVLRATGITRNAAGTFQTFTAQVKNGKNSVDTFKLSVDTSTGAVYKLDTGLKSASSAFTGLGTSVASTMKQIIGFTGVAQTVRAAFTEMKAMSDELVVYQKVTNASAQELERVRSQSYASAKKYGQSPSDFTASIAEFARAGYGQNAASMADLATKVQLVGDMSAEAASSFLLATDAGYKFGGSIEKLNSVINAANVIDNNYATSMSKIAEGMTVIAPLASSMHVSIEELMAGLGTITAVTQREGTESARAMRALFLNIMGDTTTEIEEGVTWSEKEIKTLNDALNKYAKTAVDAAKASGQVINPMEAIGALAKSYKDGLMTEADIMALVSELGGKLRSAQLMALIQNWDMYEQMLTQIKTDTSSADREVDAMSKSWSAKFQNLETSWVKLMNSRVSEDFIKDVLDLGIGFLDFSGNLENFIGMAGAATMATKSLAAGIKNLMNGVKFGGGNAWTIGLSAVIGTISAIKAAVENYREAQFEIVEQSSQKISEAFEKANGIAEIIAKYKEITDDGVIDTDELETARGLQEQLTNLVGKQAENYDLVNGKIEDQIALLSQLEQEQWKLAYGNAAAEYDKAVSAMQNTEKFSMIDLLKFPLTVLNAQQMSRGEQQILSSYKGILQGAMKDFSAESVGQDGWTFQYNYDTTADAATNFIRMYQQIKNARDLLMAEFTNNPLSGYMGQDVKSDIDELTSFVDVYGSVYEAMLPTWEAMNAYTAENHLRQKDFYKQTFESTDAVVAFVDALAEETGASVEVKDAMLEAAKAHKDYKEAAEGPSDGGGGSLEADANAAKTVADALDEATKAKERFDQAMSQDMSSGLDGYLSIIETLNAELKAGRVNSIAAHASYRELLGEEAYKSTGGYVPEIQKLLGQVLPGAVGSINEAAEILSKEYKIGDVEIEGAGIVPLMERAGVKVVDQVGNVALPAMTDDLVAQISAAWSNLPESFIRSAFMAFEQYDTQGSGTDELMGDGTDPVADNTTAVQENTAAIQGLTDAMNGGEGETQGGTDGTDGGNKGFSGTFSLAAELAQNFQEEIDEVSEGLKPVIVQAELDTEELEAKKEELEEEETTVTVKTKPDTDAAEKAISKLTQPRHFYLTAIVRSTKTSGTDYSGAVAELFDPDTSMDSRLGVKRYATGTRSHPGGISLVNDGSGPELIAQNGRAFIAGGGNPTLVSLQPGAKVFTASETRGILSGNGVPAYANGTFSSALGGVNTTLSYADLFSGSSNSTDSGNSTEKGKNNTGGNDSGKSENTTSSSAGSASGSQEEPWEKLTEMVDYILNRINKALDEQIEAVDKQIEALKEARAAADDQKELEERQQAVAEAQKDLAEAMNERTVRYLGADGKWHWMADQGNVQSAQEKLDDAQKSLDEYMDDLAFEKQISDLEKQKESLRDEFEKITETWEEIQDAVDTPTGNLASIIQSVLSGGSAQQQKGASTLQSLLISSMLQGGIFSGNYDEALNAIAQATAGSPIMPGEGASSLASLIAAGGSGDTTGALANLLSGSGSSGLSLGTSGGYINQQTNYNYYINGIQIGENEANAPLSDVMRRLAVYGNSGN